MQASKYRIEESLRNGTSVTIRAIHSNDRERFASAFEQFKKNLDAVRFRFHGLKRSITESEAIRMTDVDFVDHVCLVATLGTDAEQPIVGVGRYLVCADDREKDRAELAFAVLDKFQGKGIGSLLLRHLATIGRALGVREFLAEVLTSNNQMMAVFEHSGFPLERSTELGVVHVLLSLADEPKPKARRLGA